MRIHKYILFLNYLALMLSARQAVGQSFECEVKPDWKRSKLKSAGLVELSDKIPEGSGLAFWNGLLWTHNDSDDNRLYSLDTLTGKIVNEYLLPGCKNNDWEDMSQDDGHFYIGDFGNNAGLRDTLCIIRIDKTSLLAKSPKIDTIKFAWPKTVTKGKESKTNFNCEAMVIIGDSIYLFTKEFKTGRRSRAFSLPRIPGTYTAHYRCTLKTRLMITGAAYDEISRRLVLCGYNSWLKTSILVFDDFSTTDIFIGRASKLKLNKCVRQVEGVAFRGNRFYMVSEAFEYFLERKGELIFGIMPVR